MILSVAIFKFILAVSILLSYKEVQETARKTDYCKFVNTILGFSQIKEKTAILVFLRKATFYTIFKKCHSLLHLILPLLAKKIHSTILYDEFPKYSRAQHTILCFEVSLL